MEEPQPVQDQDPPNLQNLPAQNPDPNPHPDLPFTAPSDPPPPQPQPAVPPQPPAAVPTTPPPPVPPESKKRSLDNYGPIQECSYFKMRAVVKDIRPHFLEMLRTVDFRSCKGAEELQEKLKLLMELYKQMTAEKLSTTTPMTAPNSGENGVGLKPQEQLHDTAEQSRAGEFFAKPSEKQQGEHSQNQGTHIVGGSAFGWNFITFPGSMPIYYGRTKELFRAAQEIESGYADHYRKVLGRKAWQTGPFWLWNCAVDNKARRSVEEGWSPPPDLNAFLEELKSENRS